MKESFAVVRRSALPLLAISMLSLLPLGALTVLADLGLGVADGLRPLMNDGRSFADDADQLGGVGLLALVVGLAAAMVAPLAVGAMIAIANEPQLRIRAAVSAAWSHYEGLWVTVGAATVAPLLVFVGLVALGVASHVRFLAFGSIATIAALRLFLAPCAVMLDGLSPMDAINRSIELTQPKGRAQHLAFFVVMLGTGVLAAAIGAGALAGAAMPDVRLWLRAAEAGGALSAVLLAPWAAALFVVTYRQWRPAMATPSVLPDAEQQRWAAWVSDYVSDPARRPVALAAALRTIAAGGTSEQAVQAAWAAAWA